MTIFTINIGDVTYAKYAIPLIEKLAIYNNINLFVLDHNIEQNTYHTHPSWLKLFCHDLVSDDFIITWDLDLVPTRPYELKHLFNTNNINMAYDGSFIKENHTFNGKFKYNCGLIGIPRHYASFFRDVYDNCPTSTYPSCEQYHINDKIYDTNQNITVLDTQLNHMYDGQIDPASMNIHYTWKIQNNAHRDELIEQHYNLFSSNFI